MKESELVDRINLYLKTNKYSFANEIKMGIGIPDIMISLNMNTTNKPIDNYYILRLVDIIRKTKKTDVDYLAKKTGFNKSQIESIIIEIIGCGDFFQEEENIDFLDIVDFQNQGTNISVEVKIKDWKGGFLQAQRYLSFSDYSYLAISSEFARNVNKNDLKNFGIGLLSIGASSIEQIIRPRKSNSCNRLFKYISISKLKCKTKTLEESPNTFFNIKATAFA